MEILFSGLCSGLGAALVAGVFAIIQHRMKRRDQTEDKNDAKQEALRYLMLYIIQERAKEHLAAGEISLEDLRLLHKWHEVYHNGLSGNGDADSLLRQVEKLRIITN